MEEKAQETGYLPRCSICGNPAVIRLRRPDRHLCAGHFSIDLENRVKHTIASHAMIEDHDRIAVALSGGKDSTALLLILNTLLPAWEHASLHAITVDEGIAGYRNETIQSAKLLARTLGIRHTTVSFSGLFGKDLDALLEGREERACSICGILRRKALATAAAGAGATKLATGHNLDDEAQSVLMNVLRGDLPRLVRDSSSPSGTCFIPRVKPLRDISEKELSVYLMVNNSFPQLPECPYTRFALRAGVRSYLSGLEFRYPGTMQNLVSGKDRLSSLTAGARPGTLMNRCRECGEPCSGTVCQTCRLLKTVLG